MNSLEFLAQNIGVLGLLQRGVRNAAIKTRGDNMTALAWGRERRYRGEKSDGAAIAQVAMLGRMNADIKRMASHASRYKRICPLLSPFSRDLYGALRGKTHTHGRFDLTARAMNAWWGSPPRT